MLAAAQTLRDAVLRLPDEDRAWLVTEILSSLDGPPDSGVDAAWADEIDRRVTDIESGAVKLLDWQDVKARLAEKLRRT